MMRETQQTAIDLELNASEPEESGVSAVPSHGLMVKRERLLKDLKVHGAEAGISLVCAPDGMGKTALLLSYASEVKNDVSRGSVRLVDARSMDVEELYSLLRRLPEELPLDMRPLVAIDNMPELGAASLEAFPGILRCLRDKGIELVIACKPAARGLVQALGDSHKIGAQALVVRPREYPAWTREFAIDETLDVYSLTQGIPSLVVALRSVDGVRVSSTHLERSAVEMYERVLHDLSRSHDSLYRLACLLVLVGTGAFASLVKVGMRLRGEALARLMRDYPMFGIDAEREGFECIADRTKGMRELRGRIARARPAFAAKAMEILMASGKVDRAVQLAELVDDRDAKRDLVAHWPLQFALSGNVLFVNRIVAKLNKGSAVEAPVGMVLAVYADALVTGEYRVARSMVAELGRRQDDVLRDIKPETLLTARALARVWEMCQGVALPELPIGKTKRGDYAVMERLERHRDLWRDLIEGRDVVLDQDASDGLLEAARAPLDVSLVLLHCDDILFRALHGDVGDVLAYDKRLDALSHELRDRKLDPIADYVRMTAAVSRLMVGMPLVDERAFVDAGNSAIRAGELSMQLFCLVGEGWQALEDGQVVNARFRAQQVLRLADPSQKLLVSWATMLERVAHIVNTATYLLSDEADAIDLSKERVDSVEAWTTSLALSAAGHISELSAWYSMHKAVLLDMRFRPLARQALRAAGDKGDALRRMMPSHCAALYDAEGVSCGRQVPSIQIVDDEYSPYVGTGCIEVKLFGGFRIERNGHLLTEKVWRRKRLCAMTARLVLSHGSFVERSALIEEMWPESDYQRARENLYSVLSSLRTALGQERVGPQYILTQGEGVAINGEYVLSDVARFDVLARDILLKRTGTSGRRIIESCLKLEELYTGSLYVAELGDTNYGLKMRRQYLSKFIDCMLRGVEAALTLDDLPTASWLIEAAQRHAPYREDVMRQTMRILDRSGRRREIKELYNSHLYYLKHVAHSVPEEETRLVYEAIMGVDSASSML